MDDVAGWGVKINGKAKFGCACAWKYCWVCPLLPAVVVNTYCCWGYGWAPGGWPARSGWGKIAAGWKKGVPGGKPYAAGANGI